MSLLSTIKSWTQEPPPAYVFELSEAGVAWATTAPFQTGFTPFHKPAISVTPLKDNVVDDLLLRQIVESVVNPAIKRKTCALVLPDYCGRVTVLDFDTFPSKPEEQQALVKFRVKKTVPYDIDSAAVSYAVQSSEGKHQEVVAAVVSLEIVARYEAAFRAAGLHPGFITTASVVTLDLVRDAGVTLAARLSGRQLTLSVIDSGRLKLVRCVELPEVSAYEVEGVVVPTLAYIEDELKRKPDQLVTCGFDSQAWDWAREFGLTAQPLRSRHGAPGENNAGLFGYLERLSIA
jgi:type IV pilus assembly protein PilM